MINAAELSLQLSARETLEGDPPTADYRLVDLIVNGVLAGGALRTLRATTVRTRRASRASLHWFS